MQSFRHFIATSAAGSVAICALATVASAQPAQGPIEFHIAGGTLDAALQAYASQAGLELFYPSALVANRRVPALDGRYQPETVLHRLLSGTAIRVAHPNVRVVVLSATRAAPAAQPNKPARARRQSKTALPPEPTSSSPDAIVVTGSHIRGHNGSASPMITLDRDALDRTGRTTLADALADLPQNFPGMATEQSALTLADGSGNNASLATGINLRGLGSDATLVLVNGRRMAGSGLMGDFADVSSIPTAAVDHVDILLDGASALYGSDAIGGVVNIVLKDHYRGAETRLQLGTVTAGGARDIQAAQTMGKDWGSGSLLLSYEYYHRSALASADRRFAASSDLRPLGGTDHRLFYSSPGNILSFDPATGTFAPAYAIPTVSGRPLTAADFVPGSINLSNQQAGSDLLPRQERHSVYSRLVQKVGDRLTFSLDARYSHRAFSVAGQAPVSAFLITADNPYFVSPDSPAYDIIASGFGPELGPTQTRGFAETIGTSAGANLDLGAWQVRSYLAFAQQRERNRVGNVVNSQALSEALGSVPDDPLTSFSTARDGFFNPYGTSPNSAEMLRFIGEGYQDLHTLSRAYSYDADADGPLFDLPGGPVRLALGTDVRRETFALRNTLFLFSDRPQLSHTPDLGRTVIAGFAELRIPLIGTANARPGIQQLELSAATRTENYSDFGTTTNPKIGVIWSPANGIRLRSTYGTSFRAPNLTELSARQSVSATVLPRADGSQVAVLALSGGNPALHPEKAQSWTVGVDLAPPGLAGVHANFTWFHTRFHDRIARPALDHVSDALIDPSLAPFVQIVSPSTNAADLARVTALLAQAPGAGSYPPEAIGAIVDTRYANTAGTLVSGFDVGAGYAFRLGSNAIRIDANGTYLTHFRQTLTPTAPSIENANQVGYPVRLRGKLIGDWSNGPYGATATYNLVGAYHDLLGQRVASWSTLDLQLRYDPHRLHGPLQGMKLALSVQNLFDRDPPFTDSPQGIGYDAANADALGRFISLQLTKSW